MRQQYLILHKENDWLLDYRAQTFTKKLNAKLAQGLFEEHHKKSSGYHPQFAKAIVYCLDPMTFEILSLGGSSLLKEIKTGKIIPDMTTDQFGIAWAGIFTNLLVVNSQEITLKDDGDINRLCRHYGLNTGDPNFSMWDTQGALDGGSRIRLGSGTAIGKTDTKITTALVSAPESGYLNTNAGGYTASNTVIYQGDANPTGGSGTVREIGSFQKWKRHTTIATSFVCMIEHSAVSPSVSFTANKLLRGAYTWALG